VKTFLVFILVPFFAEYCHRKFCKIFEEKFVLILVIFEYCFFLALFDMLIFGRVFTGTPGVHNNKFINKNT